MYHNLVLRSSPTDPSKVGWEYSEMLVAGFGGPVQPQGCGADPSNSLLFCIQNGPGPYKYHYKVGGYRRQFPHLVQTVNKKFFRANSVVTTTNYTYNTTQNFQLLSSTQVTSEGETVTDSYSFPTSTSNANLFNQNRLKELINAKRIINGNLRTEKNVLYSTYNTNQILIQRVEEKMNAGAFSNLVNIVGYDTFGNVREAVQRDGIPVTFIWGHNGKRLILEVKGATYAQVLSALGGTITLSDNNRNFTAAQVSSLRNALTLGQVTHYIYGSHHGVTRITDLNGRNVNYIYDGFGRLLEVRDHDNQILERNSYNFRN